MVSFGFELIGFLLILIEHKILACFYRYFSYNK